MKHRKLQRLISAVVTLAVLGMALALSGSIAIAQSSAKAEKTVKKAKVEKSLKNIKGSDKKGKFYYRKECKTCHGKKGKGGELTPLSKTMSQWKRYFRKDKHLKNKLSEEYNPVHLIHIKTFLINHAADSDQPETCG